MEETPWMSYEQFKVLWKAQTAEELELKCAALGVDFARFKRLYGNVWEIGE